MTTEKHKELCIEAAKALALATGVALEAGTYIWEPIARATISAAMREMDSAYEALHRALEEIRKKPLEQEEGYVRPQELEENVLEFEPDRGGGV